MEKQIWKEHNFQKILISQSLNAVSQILLQVIVMLEVYQRTQSILGSSAVIAVSSLALFIGGLIASKYIDNFSLIQLMRFCGWTRALLVMLIGLCLLSNTEYGLFLLFLCLFVYSFVNAWYVPARFALLPLIVDKEQYIKANGTLVTIGQILMTAGWGLGGILAVSFPFYVIIISISVSYFISGLVISFIKVSTDNKPIKKRQPEPAWTFVLKNKVVRGITIMDATEALANSVWTAAILLAFTISFLEVGEEWWGFLNAGYFIGAMIGGLIVTFNAKKFSSSIGLMIGFSGLSMGIFTLLFSINNLPILAVFMCALMGPMYQARDICQIAILQDAIPPDRRANVMAARSAFLTPWSGVTVLIMGGLAEVLTIQTIYIIAGLMYLCAACLAFSIKSLRKYQMGGNEETNLESYIG